MRNLQRGIRNVWRNRTRTAVVLVILGLVFGLGLAMLAVETGISSAVSDIAASVGTQIEVRPAGSGGPGMMGGADTLLPDDLVKEIAGLDGVAQVSPYVLARYGEPVLPGQGTDQSPGQGPGQGWRGGIVIGVSPDQPLTIPGGTPLEVVSGRGLEAADAGKDVAIVGADLASEQGLAVGGTLTIQGRSFEIVGLLASGIRLASMGVFMPYDIAQATFGLDGVNQIYVQAASVDQVDAVTQAIRAQWGDTVDVVAQKDSFTSRLEDSLGSLTSTGRVALVLSLVVAGAVVFGAMYLIVRERAREIGILKAIGAGRSDLILQFGTEAVALSLLGAVVGLGAFALLGPKIVSALMGAAGSGLAAGGLAAGGLAGGFGARGGFAARPGLSLLSGALDMSVTWTTVAYALGAGLLLGLLGGLVPSLLAARLKPAEVIRND